MTISAVVVEDSKEILGVVEELLAQLGPYRVIGRIETEMDGTAWAERHGKRFDLAVIDLVLREGSGFNLIQRFRKASPRARILVLSDYATPAIKTRCVEIGADAVFSKGEIGAFASYLSGEAPLAEASA